MLIGRLSECHSLDSLLSGARLGRTGVLLIEGEPGVGKSRLLAYAAEQAHGFDVTRVAGTGAERDLAFGALALLLAPTAAEFDLVPQPQAHALRLALALEEGGQVDRFAVGAATLSILSRRAETRPVALLLDDAHHLDRPSAEAIVFAARRLAADAVLLVVALRADEPSPLRDAGLPTMMLGGLTEPDTVRLLAVTRGGVAPELAARVHAVTGGNPLAVLELTRDATEVQALVATGPVPVPTAIAKHFVRRASALGPWACPLLALVAAAGGDRLVVMRAGPALGLDPHAVVELEEAELVRLTPDRADFLHPLVGSSAYASLTTRRRRETHAAIVDALPSGDLARRAWHRAAAAYGPDEEAAQAVADVAVDSRHRGAYAVAAAGFERAAGLSEEEAARHHRLVHAAAAAWDAGDAGWARRLLAGVRERDLDPVTRVRARAVLGAVESRTGSLQRAHDVLVGAAREAAEVDPRAAVRLLAQAVEVAFFLADSEAASAAARLAENLVAHGVRGSAAGLGHLAIGMAEVLSGRDGVDHFREGARLLGGEDARPSAEFDPSWLMFTAMWLREDGASRLLRTAVDEARGETAIGSLPHLLFHLARDGATTNSWAAAASDYTEAITLAAELGQGTEEACSLAGLAWLEARQGLVDESTAHATRALALATERHITIAEVWARFALGEVSLSAGRTAPAIEVFGDLETWLEERSIRDVDLSPAPELVECLVHAGRRVEAAEVARRHAQGAAEKGQPWSLARAARVEGLLTDPAGLDIAFGAALELHGRTPDAFETARTQLAYGSRLRRARRRLDARSQLLVALRTFDDLGATPWSAIAADELEAAGAPVVRRGRHGLDLLTPRERQIVMLVLEGRTTRAIAAALFLSPKTVEYHLRRVYARLGISGRRELDSVMVSSEPPSP